MSKQTAEMLMLLGEASALVERAKDAALSAGFVLDRVDEVDFGMKKLSDVAYEALLKLDDRLMQLRRRMREQEGE